MNTRKIILLTTFFIFLVLVLWYQKTAQPPEDLITTDSLYRFVPEDLNLQTIDALTITQPDGPGIRLEKKEKQWQLPQWGGVPANKHNVDRLLEALGTLRGELRSSDHSILADYALKEDQALSLALLHNGTEQLHLLVGKGDFRNLFLRMHNSTEVYVAPGMILSHLGAYGGALSEQFWIEPILLSLNIKDISELHLDTPEAKAILQRVSSNQKDMDTEIDQDNWKFTQIKESGLTQAQMEAILLVLDQVCVVEVLPLDSPEREELAQPTHVLEIVTKTKTLRLEAVQGISSKLIREKNSPHMYKIHDTTFERLFPPVTIESTK